MSYKPAGVFINTAEANCSIYACGRMMYDSLNLSDRFEIDYLEIDADRRRVSDNYDFYAFNYHHQTMGWLDTRFVRRLPGLKATFVLETLPNDPFVLCPARDFDVYCALDPTIQVTDRRVYAFPRPLEKPAGVLPPVPATGVPVIGSFGFATPGKGFELVVEAVNREFDRAIVRINIPPSIYSDGAWWNLQRRNYAEYLGELSRKVAREGIEVVVTHDYLSKEELITWCARNTLNCFLYSREKPGLAATTDQAIASGRPLAVSDCSTFRHLHRYLKPFPFRSLRESIAASQKGVRQMQQDWAPINFAHHFEKVLEDHGSLESEGSRQATERRRGHTIATEIELPIRGSESLPRSFLHRAWERIVNKGQRRRAPGEKTRSAARQVITIPVSTAKHPILIVSHRAEQCGIHQYGLNVFGALQKSSRYSFAYTECSNETELRQAIQQIQPSGILYNYFHGTMPWLNSQITRLYSFPQLGTIHEVTQEEADQADTEMFDFHLCADPTLVIKNPFIFKTRRLIPPYMNDLPLPEVPTIGSFGFGIFDKGFERLIQKVQEEFDQANIVLQLPFNDIVDPAGQNHALATAERCRRAVVKSGITLTIHHDFLDKQRLLEFLGSNTINAFFYDVHKHRGISSTIEHALAVQRPLAVNRCGMFRHVHSAAPSICIEDSSLREIIANGVAPLVPFFHDWSEASFILDYEGIFDQVFASATGACDNGGTACQTEARCTGAIF